MKGTQLNLRGVEAELLKRTKALAARMGVTLRQFVSEALRREVERRETK